jgi:hypothetical protein
MLLADFALRARLLNRLASFFTGYVQLLIPELDVVMLGPMRARGAGPGPKIPNVSYGLGCDAKLLRKPRGKPVATPRVVFMLRHVYKSRRSRRDPADTEQARVCVGPFVCNAKVVVE